MSESGWVGETFWLFVSIPPVANGRRRATNLDNIRHARRPLKPNERFRVFERDGFACRYCGQSAPNVILHVDHRRPVSKGGNNHPDNLYTACSSCNAGKAGSDEFVIEEQRVRAMSHLAIMKMLQRFSPLTMTYAKADQIEDFLASSADPSALLSLIAEAQSPADMIALWYEHEGFPDDVAVEGW